MSKLKKNLDIVIYCVCELVVGMLLLLNPVGYTQAIITVAGILLVALGIRSVVDHLRLKPEEAAHDFQLTIGLIEITAGIFCMTNSGWFISTFTVLTVIYGVALLVIGFVCLQRVIDLIRLKRGQWVWSLLGAVVSFAMAALIFTNPFESTSLLWSLTALALIVEAVLGVIGIFVVEDGE